MDQNLYQLQNIKYYYNCLGAKNNNSEKLAAVNIDNLKIKQSTILGLWGPNGCGKTTLLKLLAFIEKPQTGKIFYNQKPAFPFCQSARFNVTLMPQNPYLMKRSVFDNIYYGLKIRKIKDDIENKIHQAISIVGFTSNEILKKNSNELSGGEAQRIALAARLVLKPKVLLLDEPISNIDEASASLIKDAIEKIRKSWDTTIVLASHDLQWLHETCDEVLHMYNGKLIGNSIKNIICGPWELDSADLWRKKIDNNQTFIVKKPPKHDSIAILDPSLIKIKVSKNDLNEKNHVLTGTIINMIAEKFTKKIIITIKLGDLNLFAKIDKQQISNDTNSDSNYYPGNKVAINYNLDAIKWV